MSPKLVKHCRAYGQNCRPKAKKLNTAAVRNCYDFANVPICNRKEQGYENICTHLSIKVSCKLGLRTLHKNYNNRPTGILLHDSYRQTYEFSGTVGFIICTNYNNH